MCVAVSDFGTPRTGEVRSSKLLWSTKPRSNGMLFRGLSEALFPLTIPNIALGISGPKPPYMPPARLGFCSCGRHKSMTSPLIRVRPAAGRPDQS